MERLKEVGVDVTDEDDLNELIDELAEDDPALQGRIADALARRELARAVATLMGTSQ